MSKARSTGNLNNSIVISDTGAITFVSGSTTLATLNTTGQLSGSAPVVFAATSSFANAFTVAGTLTAQTLVVQTVTSSVSFITGSTRFGSIVGNTHQFTGSMGITGSLSVVTNGTEFQVNTSGVNLGNALIDSHVISGSLTVNPGGLFVSSSGFVGMGTTTPRYALDVQTSSGIGNSVATGSGLIRAITSGTGDGVLIGQADSARSVGIGANQFKIYGDDYAIMTMGANPLYLATSGSTRLTVTSTGNIQIDNGQLNTPKSLYFQANSSAGGNLGSIDWYNVQWDGFVRAQIKGETDSALSNGRLVFSTGAGGVTERMRITSTGNVLINKTTAAGYNLEVSGAAYYDKSDGTYIALGYGGSVKGYIGISSQTQVSGVTNGIGLASANDMTFATGGSASERMRIKGNDGSIITQAYINLTDVVSQVDNASTWPIMSFSGANGTSGVNKSAGSYDWGIIKAPTSYGYYGRVVGGFHASSTVDQGFITSGWTMQFIVNGSNGNAFLRGTLSQGSDARIKANVVDLQYGLNELMQLRAVSYNKKIFNKDNDGNILSESIDTENKYIGFIAQEVKPIIPEVVNGDENSENPERGLSIEYQNMTAILVKAIQELKAENDTLKEILQRNNIQ